MHLVLLLKGQVRESHMPLKDPSGKHQILFCYQQLISIFQALAAGYVVH